MEEAFTHAGYPELGYWVRIGIHIGASALTIILLRMVWTVIAGFVSIISTVLAWVFYPPRLVFILFHRLFFGSGCDGAWGKSNEARNQIVDNVDNVDEVVAGKELTTIV